MRYLILIATVLVALTAYTVFWFHVKGEVEGNVAAWVAEERAAGETVKYSSIEIGGYPFRIEATVSKPVFGHVSPARDWTVQGDTLRVIAAPWNLRHIVAYHEGPFEIHYGIVRSDGRRRTIDLSGKSDAAGASAVWKGGKWDHGDFETSNLSLMAQNAVAPLTVGHLEFHVRLLHPGTPEESGGIDQPGQSEYAIEASDVSFPGATDKPFGKAMQSFNTVLEVHGDKPFAFSVPEIEAWRDAGGTVDVKSFALDWGPLHASVMGSLALDEANRPTGALTAKFTDYDALVDALGGATKSGQDPGLKQFLNSLTQASGQPQGTLTLPFSMQDGTLYLGPVAVATVPPLLDVPTQAAPAK